MCPDTDLLNMTSCSKILTTFYFLKNTQHNLMTVNLVSFFGSIISVSFNNKELLNEVGDAQRIYCKEMARVCNTQFCTIKLPLFRSFFQSQEIQDN